MSQPPSGMEPQLGGHGTPSDEARADADACFAQALDAIRKQRWDAAKESLNDVLVLVYDYPQAKGLLSLIRDIQGAIMRGEDERPQIEAMRAYIYAFQNAPRAITPRAEPPLRTSLPASPPRTPITLPWVEEFQQRNASRQREYPPEYFRELPSVTDPQAPSSAPMYIPEPASGTVVEQTISLRVLSAANPLDQLRVLWWFFIRPLRVKAYVRSGEAVQVERVLGWLASALLWLPLAIPALGLALNTLPADGLVMLWMLGVIVLMWWVCGWMMTHDSGAGALMLGSMVWICFVPIFMNYVGFRVGALIGVLFLVLAGFAAGINGIGPGRSSAHLALGATFVTTIGAAYKMYTYITPIVWAYLDNFLKASSGTEMLGRMGGPILIMFAVVGTALFTLGITFIIPIIATYFVSFAVEAVLEESLGGGANPLGAFALSVMLGLYAILIWVSFAGGWRIIDAL